MAGGVQIPKLTFGTGFDDDDGYGPVAQQKQAEKKKSKKDQQAGPMPMDVACHEGVLSQVVLLWAQGLSITEPDQQGFQPLMWASLKNQVAVARFLLDNGAGANTSSADGQSALMWAATENSIDAAKVLLDSGVDVAATDQHGYTAACIAVQNGHLSFLHMLATSSTVDPTQQDNDGHHMTTWAAYKGEFAVLEYLHQVLGCPLNGVDKSRRTALHWAAREGHTDCAIYLMANGVSTNLTDVEGITALEHAEQRHHVETAAAIRNHVTTQDNHCVGTLQLVANNKAHLVAFCAAPVYFILHYLWSNWMIPVWAHIPISAYFSKNMMFSFFRHSPIKNSVPEASILEELGAPKTVMGAFRGPIQLRRRETANLTALFGFFAVQFVAAVKTGVPIPSLFIPLCLLMAISILLAKSNCFKNVMEDGNIKEDPSLALVERGEHHHIHPRVHDQRKHLRIPLRAFYCVEIDRIVKRFDNFSVLLDCPISSNNHRPFFTVLVCLFLCQVLWFVSAWQYMTAKHCPADHNFSFMRTMWNLAFSNLPCPVKLSTDTWEEWFFPKPDNVAGCWLISYTVPLAVFTLAVIGRQLAGICHGVSRAELADPTAPTTNGEMQSIQVGNGYVFSEGGKFANFLLWCLGKQGTRWESMTALPAKAQ